MVTHSPQDEVVATLEGVMVTLDLLMRRLRSIERRLSLLTVAVIVTFVALVFYLIGQAAH